MSPNPYADEHDTVTCAACVIYESEAEVYEQRIAELRERVADLELERTAQNAALDLAERLLQRRTAQLRALLKEGV